MPPRWSPPTKGGWSLADRSARAFAVSQFDLHDKTETYEISGIPRAAARTCSAGAAPTKSRSPNSRSIARVTNPPGRPRDRGNRRPDGPGRHARTGSRRRHRQQVRHRDAARLIGGADRARLPRLHQAGRRAQFPDLRLVVPGRRSMPARRAAIACMLNRLTLLAAGNDAETGGIVRPRRTQAQRLRRLGRTGAVGGLADRRRQPAAARRLLVLSSGGLLIRVCAIMATPGQDTGFHETFSLSPRHYCRPVWRN